jgi:glycerate 2-kinase
VTTNPVSIAADRELLTSLYDAAVAAVDPTPATTRAIEELDIPRGSSVWLFAFGKAAPAMARGATESLLRSLHQIAGGLVVGVEPSAPPYGTITAMTGDHPIPGARSFACAARIGEIVAGRKSGDVAIVLVSGGTSSLIGAPVQGLDAPELARLNELLLASGLGIREMNVVRKRFSRWGAGRLAIALAPAVTHCLAISDVVGDDPSNIGSGPCAPDPTTAQEVRELLESVDLFRLLHPTYRDHLVAAMRRVVPETPKPTHPAFAHVTTRVILRNQTALMAAVAQARAMGDGIAHVEMANEPLVGDAAQKGAELARELLHRREARGDGGAICRLWGGETTVALGVQGARARAQGGRCQELALSAARVLHEAGDAAAGITLLAAGTDGRDGPTDAAGACVDASTWSAIGERGIDPAAALAEHRSYEALDAAGALLRRGPTGTNVTDIVLALVR